MDCVICRDKGLVRLNWAGAPEDFAVCLCEIGLRLRVDRNHTATSVAPLWRVWAAREHVDPDRIFMLEDVLTPVELNDLGFNKTAVVDSMAAIIAAAQARSDRINR
jgi:hypothetical protein